MSGIRSEMGTDVGAAHERRPASTNSPSVTARFMTDIVCVGGQALPSLCGRELQWTHYRVLANPPTVADGNRAPRRVAPWRFFSGGRFFAAGRAGYAAAAVTRIGDSIESAPDSRHAGTEILSIDIKICRIYV